MWIMSKGIIFKYMNEKWETVKAVAVNDEQKPCYSNYGKVFLRVVDDDYNFKKTEEGKGIIAVKNVSDLTQIGFWN